MCIFLCIKAAAFLFVLMGPAQKAVLLRAEVDFGDFSPRHPLWVVSTFAPFLRGKRQVLRQEGFSVPHPRRGG